MQEVSKENSNHCVSGGFIFDQMDRFAHDCIMKEFGLKCFLFTQKAEIVFNKQICDWSLVHMDKFYETIFDKTITILVVIVDQKDNLYAKARFTFIAKDHAYCDTKGE